MAEDVMQGTSRLSRVQARRSRRLTLPSPVSFWVSVAMMVLFMYAAAPTSLYRVYVPAARHRQEPQPAQASR